MASKYPERGRRLEIFFNSLNIKRKVFCENINTSYKVLSLLMNGHATLTANIVDRVVQAYPNLNAAWILRGDGEMLLSHSATSAVAEPKPDYGPKAITLDSLTDVIRSLQDQVDSLEKDRRTLLNALSRLDEQNEEIEKLQTRVSALEGIAKEP